MNKKKRLFVAAMLAGSAFAANAADNTVVKDCIDLGSDQEIVRSGGAQSFALRDGGDHYLVSFKGNCSSLATARKISIVDQEGTANRLCPQHTKVKTDRDNCSVGQVQAIDAEDFAGLKKRASR